jgi:hypothetical protein
MKYEVELWTRGNKFIADISRLATGRSWTRERNEAETLSFSVDLESLEKLALAAGESAYAILEPYAIQFRLKRNGSYLFGGEIASTNTSLNANGGSIDVQCWGYLNMLKYRYITNTYTGWNQGDIAWDIINQLQSITNGSMGFTRDLTQSYLGNSRDRTYERVNAKDAIQAFTTLSDQSLDVNFTYDKKFQTYQMIGSLRSDLSFVYPQNIISVSVPREATTLYNRIYGLGSGFGADQLISIQEDALSESIYGMREDVEIYNSVVDQPTLTENTRNFLARNKSILEIPQMTVRGADIDLNTVIPGDRVPVRISSHSFLNSVDGTYRIERLEVRVDDNDEEEVRVFFDDFGL